MEEGKSDYLHKAEIRGSTVAADLIVRIILDLIGPVRSVVDLGGGTGAWCRAFKSAGVAKVLCIDHPAALSEGLLIEQSEFQAADLSKDNPNPAPSDLAISLEFAEHLSMSRANWIVDFLTQSATTIIFSAAIPNQDGVGHINEQWPRFWANLFEAKGFTQLDVIRPRIIHDPEIPYWYRQNLFLYTINPKIYINHTGMLPQEFICIHEEVLRRHLNPTLRMTLSNLLPALKSAVQHRWHRRFKSKQGFTS